MKFFMVVAQSKNDPSQKFVLSEFPSEFDARDYRLEWTSKESADEGHCPCPLIAQSNTKDYVEEIMADPTKAAFRCRWRDFLAKHQDKVIQFKEMELKI